MGMTATDDLRRLLDERGVKYDVRDGKVIKNTYWDDDEGRRWGYASDKSGVIKDRQLFLVRGRMDITPEQAIAATLGRGTCHIVMISPGWWECDECANSIDWDSCDPNDPPSCNFCPNCGREVIE